MPHEGRSCAEGSSWPIATAFASRHRGRDPRPGGVRGPRGVPDRTGRRRRDRSGRGSRGSSRQSRRSRSARQGLVRLEHPARARRERRGGRTRERTARRERARPRRGDQGRGTRRSGPRRRHPRVTGSRASSAMRLRALPPGTPSSRRGSSRERALAHASGLGSAHARARDRRQQVPVPDRGRIPGHGRRRDVRAPPGPHAGDLGLLLAKWPSSRHTAIPPRRSEASGLYSPDFEQNVAGLDALQTRCWRRPTTSRWRSTTG